VIGGYLALKLAGFIALYGLGGLKAGLQGD
jgi:hypothetical protein